MPVFEGEGTCPRCGTAMLFHMVPSDDAPPEVIAALQRGMAQEAARARQRRRNERAILWIRFCWYLVAFLSAWAAFARVTGPEMAPWWSAALANATTAVVAFSVAAWVINLKLWTDQS